MAKRLTEDKLEDIVVDEPLALCVLDQLESLREVHGTLFLVNLWWRSRVSSARSHSDIMGAYKELSGNEDHDSLALEGGLGIKCRDGVLHLPEWEALRKWQSVHGRWDCRDVG